MHYILSKTINLVKQFQYEFFIVVCLILVSTIAFNLGRATSITKTPLTISQNANILNAIASSSADKSKTLFLKADSGSASNAAGIIPTPADPRVVVSKTSSSKKYHYSWCASGKKIKPENQIWFNTEQEAIAAGYTLAGNCRR